MPIRKEFARAVGLPWKHDDNHTKKFKLARASQGKPGQARASQGKPGQVVGVIPPTILVLVWPWYEGPLDYGVAAPWPVSPSPQHGVTHHRTTAASQGMSHKIL